MYSHFHTPRHAFTPFYHKQWPSCGTAGQRRSENMADRQVCRKKGSLNSLHQEEEKHLPTRGHCVLLLHSFTFAGKRKEKKVLHFSCALLQGFLIAGVSMSSLREGLPHTGWQTHTPQVCLLFCVPDMPAMPLPHVCLPSLILSHLRQFPIHFHFDLFICMVASSA